MAKTIAELNKEIGIGKAGSIDSRYFPDVQPLPMTVRSKFMKALQAEQDGLNAEAAALLDEAIIAETK